MQKRFAKYFWDGNSDTFSPQFRVKRILEYASFPDLIAYPFEEIKQHLPLISLDSLRTSQKRKDFLHLLLPFLNTSQTWDDLFAQLLEKGRAIWKEAYSLP